MKKIKVIALMCSIGIMILIFFFSSQNGTESKEVSGEVTQKVVEVVAKSRTEEKKAELAEQMEYYVRKAAHFLIFASLGLSVITTVKGYMGRRNRDDVIMAAAICVLYACMDEFHQGFVGERSMKFTDVLIDSTGAFLGIAIFFLLYRTGKTFVDRALRRDAV